MDGKALLLWDYEYVERREYFVLLTSKRSTINACSNRQSCFNRSTCDVIGPSSVNNNDDDVNDL